MVTACDKEPSELSKRLSTRRSVPRSKKRISRSKTVALVNGTPITQDEIERDTSKDRSWKEALDQRIRIELLAQEARRQGFAGDIRVQRRSEDALAQQFITDFFVESFRPKDIPYDLLERAYRLNRHKFKHPELVRVSHIVALAGMDLSEKERKRAQKAAYRVHKIAAAGKLSPDEFAQIRDLVAKEFPQNKLIVEDIVTGQKGYTVPEFSSAAFRLKRKGDISPVVQTRFGFHVLYYKGRKSARDDALSKVEQEVRDLVFEDARRVVFEQRLRELEKKYAVKYM